jgi:hypothetical protein
MKITTSADNKEPAALPIQTIHGEALIVKLIGIDALPINIQSNAILTISIIIVGFWG